MNFAIRYDGSWTDTSLAVISEIVTRCEKAVFYEHPATPQKVVHIHGLIWGWTKKEDTLRNILKRIKGQGSYECKQKIRPRDKNSPPVNEQYIRYMTKGKFDPEYVKGFSDELIAEEKAKGYDVLDTVGGKLVVKKGEKNPDGETPGRKTRKELVDVIVNDLREDISRLSTEDIVSVIRKHLIRNNEVIGMYKVIDIYDSVMMYACEGQWIEMISRKIISRNRI